MKESSSEPTNGMLDRCLVRSRGSAVLRRAESLTVCKDWATRESASSMALAEACLRNSGSSWLHRCRGRLRVSPGADDYHPSVVGAAFG